jgi:hypothetical protein
MSSYLVENAGVFANLAGIAAIIAFAALFIFFAGVPVFGPINDAASVFQMLFLIPVALALHRIFRAGAPTLSLLATSIAIFAMLVIAVLQGLLVLKLVRFEQTLKTVLVMGGVVGVWWLLVAYLASGNSAFPSGLAWTSVIAGLSGVLLVVGFWLGGQQHPLAAIGFMANGLTAPVWTFWLARLLLSGSLVIPA